MSSGFFSRPLGLRRESDDIVFADHEVSADAWEHGLGTYTCDADHAGALIECQLAGDSTNTWEQDVAALGSTAVVADYYAVYVNFASPSGFDLATDGCGALPGNLGCGPGLAVVLQISISGGEYLVSGNTTTGSPVSVETDATADNGGWVFQNTASLNDGGYLENPSPVWPAPDANGNQFGRVLFTRAQLLALPPVAFTVNALQHAGPGFDVGAGQSYTTSGTSSIRIIPYNETAVVVPSGTMCIIHYA